MASPIAFGRLRAPYDLLGAASALALGAATLLWAARGARMPQFHLADLGVLLFSAGAVASLIRTPDVYSTLATLSRFLGYSSAYFCARILGPQVFPALGRLAPTPPTPAAGAKPSTSVMPAGRWLLLGGLVGGAFVSATLGVRAYAISALWLDNPSWRTFGTFYNPNAFAGYLGLCLFPAIALTGLASTRILRASAAIALATIVAALVLTASKGGLLAVLVAAAAFGAWRVGQSSRPWVRKVNPIVAAALIALLLAALAFLFPPARIRLMGAFREAHSVLFRWYTWAATLRMAADHPVLGWGLGTYSQIMLRYTKAGFTGMAHNDYLQLWSEGGLLTLAGWLVALGGLVRAVRRGAGAARTSRLLQIGCACGVLTFAAHGLVDYDFYIEATGGAAFVLLALACGAGETGAEPGARGRAGGLARVGIVILACSGVFACFGAAADLRAEAGEKWMQEGNALLAERQFSRGTRLMPINGALRLQYARFLYALAQPGSQYALGAGPSDLTRPPLPRGYEQIRSACRLQPQVAINFRWLGVYEEARGRPAAALRAYARSVQLNPHYLPVYVAVARLRLRGGDRSGADQALRRVTEIEGGPYERVKAVPDLIELDYARAHLYLAALALERGEYNRAAEEASAARRTTAAYLQSSTVKTIMESRGQEGAGPGLALDALTYAVEAEALSHLSPAQAEAAWESALREDPEARALLRNLRKEWMLP